MQTHPRGHLVYAARGVLSVHTERGTSIVPANRVAWTPAGFTHHHRAHGETDMRILFLPASLARLVPGHPAVFAVSDLARAALLTLTPKRLRGYRPLRRQPAWGPAQAGVPEDSPNLASSPQTRGYGLDGHG